MSRVPALGLGERISAETTVVTKRAIMYSLRIFVESEVSIKRNEREMLVTPKSCNPNPAAAV